KDVVAHQQRVFHRSGRYFKGLNDKSNDKESGHKYRGNARNRFGKAFLLFLRLLVFVFSEQTGFLWPIHAQKRRMGAWIEFYSTHQTKHAVPAGHMQPMGHLSRMQKFIIGTA